MTDVEDLFGCFDEEGKNELIPLPTIFKREDNNPAIDTFKENVTAGDQGVENDCNEKER